MRLCSACLLGVKCRYDGMSKKNSKVVALSKKEILIPICPEQLGGLSTPRSACEQIINKQIKCKNKVITNTGKDVTKEFILGSKEVLRIAKLLKINKAILKQGSPSCGYGQIYDGTFKKKLITGEGITAALLKKHNIQIITEEDL